MYTRWGGGGEAEWAALCVCQYFPGVVTSIRTAIPPPRLPISNLQSTIHDPRFTITTHTTYPLHKPRGRAKDKREGNPLLSTRRRHQPPLPRWKNPFVSASPKHHLLRAAQLPVLTLLLSPARHRYCHRHRCGVAAWRGFNYSVEVEVGFQGGMLEFYCDILEGGRGRGLRMEAAVEAMVFWRGNGKWRVVTNRTD